MLHNIHSHSHTLSISATTLPLHVQPTNHLDLHALVWLENWLNNVYTGITVVVSHDTCFLNTIGTDIIELQSAMNGRSSSSLIQYAGDYCTYECTLQDTKKNVLRNKDLYDGECIGYRAVLYMSVCMYLFVCICVCMCVCVYVCVCIFENNTLYTIYTSNTLLLHIYIYTHTHTYIPLL